MIYSKSFELIQRYPQSVNEMRPLNA